MPAIRYTGPFDEVEIPSLDNVKVAKGGVVEVTNEQAKGFVNQAVWEIVQAAPTKDAGK